MSKINLSKAQINAGINRAMKVFTDADKDSSRTTTTHEVDQFQGRGAAAIRKVYKYAEHIQGGGGVHNGVPLSTCRAALDNLRNAIKDAADNKGNKDGHLDGDELKYLSTAAASLVRFTHATKP